MLSDDKKYIVYQLKFPNGKLYVGITSCSFNARMGQHKRKETNGDKSRMGRAIQKYKWDNIKKEILIKNASKDIACYTEMGLIRDLDLLNRDMGYNLSTGGEINRGYKVENPHNNSLLSPERRKEISMVAVAARESDPDYLEKLSDAVSRFPVMATNVKTGESIEFKNASVCEDYLEVGRTSVYSHIKRNGKLLKKEWKIVRI